MDHPRSDRPAPQAALLVHLTIRKAAAILHGGRQHKSCCDAQKKGTRVWLYSPSVKPHVPKWGVRVLSALPCTKWILVLVIDRYDLLVFCRPFSVCKVHCMKFVKTKPSSSGMSYCNHLLFVLALTFEWLVLPNESVSHNCTSPRIARGIKFDKRCSHTSLWFVWELPRIKSCIQHTILEHYGHLLSI